MFPTSSSTQFEQPFWDRQLHVVGVDEAGRGPLAGPVIAAAVVLPSEPLIEGITDSKLLKPDQRQRLFEILEEVALTWGVGLASHEEIDRMNILQASQLAMRRALRSLSIVPVHVFVDGPLVPDLGFAQTALIKGDRRCYSISAASILAKVVRDEIMCELDAQFPGYGFARHKGYPTAEHAAAIARLGLSPVHRRTFHVPKSR